MVLICCRRNHSPVVSTIVSFYGNPSQDCCVQILNVFPYVYTVLNVFVDRFAFFVKEVPYAEAVVSMWVIIWTCYRPVVEKERFLSLRQVYSKFVTDRFRNN